MIVKYGIAFPIVQSLRGDFIKMTENIDDEVRSNLIHLLLTRKGSRYMMPDFGTRLYEFIFEMNDNTTFNQIEEEIRESVRRYIPNLNINSINVSNYIQENEINNIGDDLRLFRVPDSGTEEYTAKIRVDFSVNNGTFSTSDFIIINI